MCQLPYARAVGAIVYYAGSVIWPTLVDSLFATNVGDISWILLGISIALINLGSLTNTSQCAVGGGLVAG
jgi:hypothetical protein